MITCLSICCSFFCFFFFIDKKQQHQHRLNLPFSLTAVFSLRVREGPAPWKNFAEHSSPLLVPTAVDTCSQNRGAAGLNMLHALVEQKQCYNCAYTNTNNFHFPSYTFILFTLDHWCRSLAVSNCWKTMPLFSEALI